MYDPPPSVVAQCPDQPSAVDEVLARALAKSPEDRYGTCEELIDALRTAFAASPRSLPDADTGPPPDAGEQVPPSKLSVPPVSLPPVDEEPPPVAEEPPPIAEEPPQPVDEEPPRPEPEDDSEAAVETVTIPRPPSRTRDSGQTEEQPSRKRPRGRHRTLIIVTTAAVAVVAVVGALLAAHPWTHPPVLKPAGLTAKSGLTNGSSTTDSVEISWSGPATGPLPDQYEIFRNGIQIGTVLGTETSYTDNGLAPNTSYGFQVIAVRSGKQSPVSATLKAQTPPLQPTGLAVKGETTSSLEIAWSGPAAGPPPGGYEILRNGTALTTVPGSITSYTDKGLDPDTGYSYQVIAVTGSNQSPASATLTSARTTKPPLSAAVLTWSGPVTEKMISINPAETGWQLQPGSSTRDTWTFSPVCSSGPCDATLTGAYDGYPITAKLTRSGATYTGTAQLKNDYYCSNKRQAYSGTLTVNVSVNGAGTQGGVWTATSIAGHETVNIPVAYNCYATTAQLDVKSG
jgi:hypothetical protein